MTQTLANIERGEKSEFNYEFFDDIIQRKQLANTKKVQIQKSYLSFKTLKLRRWNKREDFMTMGKLKMKLKNVLLLEQSLSGLLH